MSNLIIHNIANYIHVLASMALLLKIWATQDCAGLSAKSQLLYTLVYTTRYLDVLTVFISQLNTTMKIIYLSLGFSTILSIFIFRKTYEKDYDTFRIEWLIIPCLAIATMVNYYCDRLEILWTFSIYLEAVAMLPQFKFVAEAKHIHKHILYYVMAVFAYKSLYVPHWINRYYQEGHYDPIAIVSCVIAILVYCYFFVGILPKLETKVSGDDLRVQDDLTTVENGMPTKSGHLVGNISTIILSPATLVSVDKDKEHLLKNER